MRGIILGVLGVAVVLISAIYCVPVEYLEEEEPEFRNSRAVLKGMPSNATLKDLNGGYYAARKEWYKTTSATTTTTLAPAPPPPPPGDNPVKGT